MDEAHRVFQVLCTAVNTDTLWDRYAPQTIEMLAAADPQTRQRVFFSQEFFSKWLDSLSGDLKDWQRAEDRFLKTKINELLQDRKECAVLDVGCGWGRHMEMLLGLGCSYVAGVDGNPHMVERAMRLRQEHLDRVDVFLQDAVVLPWAADTFHVVVCMTNTFGNIPPAAQQRVLQAMGKVLKPGGKVILSVYAHDDAGKVSAIRAESYRAIGLRVVKVGKVIHTDEGLESEEFTQREVEDLFRTAGFMPHVESLDGIGLVCVATKS